MLNLTESQLAILVVEPSPTQLKIILRQLREAGIQKVDGVNTAYEALEISPKYPPDLIISAMYLPDMTATELLSAVHQQTSLADTHFMLISSETSPQALEPLRQAGVVAILPKPFEPAALQRALRTTIEFVDPQEIHLDSFDAGDLQVLVVDDSRTARRHIQRVLENMGIEAVSVAENGVEALELLQSQHFDLLVSDLNMPQMDGQELTAHIRQQMGDTLIPILLVTTEQNQARLGSVQQAGVSAILDKPFEPAAIREMLYRVLDGDG